MSRINLITCLLLIISANEAFSQRNNPFGGFNSPAKEQFKPQQQTKTPEKPAPKYFNGKCPESNGRYAVDGQCDAYVECRDGVPEDKLCADGLLFNAEASIFTFPCQYPIDVDCSTRARLQPAQATDECPHQFGYFRLGDATHCGQFMNCADGRGYTFDCPEGLAFHKGSYRCDWPDQVPDCDAEAFLGFTCPPEPEIEGLGPKEFKFYPSPHDCFHYYACIEGHPRLYNCGEENAFDVTTNTCQAAENVTTCINGKQVSGGGSQQIYQKPSTYQSKPFAQQQSSSQFSGFGQTQKQKQPVKPTKQSSFGSFGQSNFGSFGQQSSQFTGFGQQQQQVKPKQPQSSFGSFGQQQSTFGQQSNRGNYKY